MSDIASTIPLEPAAIRVPPVITHSELKSIAVLPSLVGPDTYVSPPEMYNPPLESSPSPSAITVSLPPEMLRAALESVAIGSLPVLESGDVALSPSSLAFTVVSPPAILIIVASIPSLELAILTFPPTILILPSECKPSLPALAVTTASLTLMVSLPLIACLAPVALIVPLTNLTSSFPTIALVLSLVTLSVPLPLIVMSSLE